MDLILASSSPRRREMFKLIGLDFTVMVSEADENIVEQDPKKFVTALAKRKAEAVFKKRPDACVVGSDTVVLIDGRIIGKPKDRQDAFKILSTLNGRTHTVYTGLAVLAKNSEQLYCDETRVTFAKLSDEELWHYIGTGEPLDKAGAYGIQGPGAILVEKIEGCYFTVIGMPVPVLYRLLKNVGITPKWMK